MNTPRHQHLNIRLLGPQDAPVLSRIAPDIFDGAVSEHWLRAVLGSPQQHLAVAIDDGVVIGMALATQVLHPDKASELWVQELAVAATHRQSGIGTQLLQCLQAKARAMGCRQMLVMTEADNAAAQALYQSIGAKRAAGAFNLFLQDL